MFERRSVTSLVTFKEKKGHILSIVFFKLSFKRIYVQVLVHANENQLSAKANTYFGVNYCNLCL